MMVKSLKHSCLCVLGSGRDFLEHSTMLSRNAYQPQGGYNTHINVHELECNKQW